MYFWDQIQNIWQYNPQFSYLVQPQQLYQFPVPFITDSNHTTSLTDSSKTQVNRKQATKHQIQNARSNKKQASEPQIEKNVKQNHAEFIKVSRNIKSSIIKQFVKLMRKDASKMLFLKERLRSSYPIKNFMEKLYRMVPLEKDKYIRVRTIQELCFNPQDEQFALFMRILLRNFLNEDFQIYVLNKKKNKAEFLKGARELYRKIFDEKLSNSHS